MIIDFEHHYLPQELNKEAWPPGLSNIEEHLRNMELAGIDMAVLSAHSPPLEECKVLNDRLSQLQKLYPKKITGLVHTIPSGGKEALDELERGINILGLKGVAITAQPEGRPLDDTQLLPFYEKVQKLGIPIYIHCSTKGLVGFSALNASYRMDIGFGWELELMTATTRLIMGGILEDLPELKIVISHFGGGIASILERLGGSKDGQSAPVGPPPPKMKKPFREYVSKLYFDMAGFLGGMDTVRCFLTALEPQQLLFATDYPYNFYNKSQDIKKYIQNIKNLDLPGKTKEDILGGNAMRLLKLTG